MSEVVHHNADNTLLKAACGSPLSGGLMRYSSDISTVTCAACLRAPDVARDERQTKALESIAASLIQLVDYVEENGL